MIDLNKYMNKKLIQSMIYSGELYTMLDDEELREGIIKEDFLVALNEFVNENMKNPHIEGKHLDALRNLVHEIRFMQGVNKSLCNDMVGDLNQTRETGEREFVRSEFIKRFSLNPFIGNNLQIFAQYTLPQMHDPHIFSSVAFDFIMLDQLISTDPMEMDTILEELPGLEHQTINTINAVKIDAPVLFSDEVFNINSSIVLEVLKNNEDKYIRKRAGHALKRK